MSSQYGFLIPHHQNMLYMVKGHIYGLEADLSKQTCGKKMWEEIFYCPQIGLCFYYINLANPKELGEGYGFSPFVNFPLFPKGRTKYFLRYATGIGYVTRVFDRVENNKNFAISAHVNAFIQLRLNTRFNLCREFFAEAGLGMAHFSNGASKAPNLGINLPTVSLALGVNGGKPQKKGHCDTLCCAERKKEFSVLLAGGIREINPPGGKKYGAFTFSVNRHKVISLKSRFGYGVDICYNSANQFDLEKDSTFKGTAGNFTAGAKLCYELRLGKIGIPIEMGLYAYNLMKNNGDFFHRIGTKYYVNRNWVIFSTLKTHFAKADYIEWGAGYRF